MTSVVKENQFDSNDFDVIDDWSDNVNGIKADSESALRNMTSPNEGRPETGFAVTNKQMNERDEMHSKWEAKWLDEKEKLLESIKSLNNNLKEKDEELKKNNNGHENRVQEMKTEYAALVSKFKEMQAMIESEKQGNVELGDEIEKINEMADENMKKKDEHIEEINKKLKKEEKKYKELAAINDKLEEENDMARDTELKKTKLQEQINKMENASNANVKELKHSNASLKAELEGRKNEKATLDKMNDDLEEEIIMLKLDLKKLQSGKEEYKKKYECSENKHLNDILQLTENIETLTKKCDDSENRCDELNQENQRLVDAEQKLKRDFATEKNQLKGELQVLSDETEVLRQRNEHRGSPEAVVRSGRKQAENPMNDLKEVMARLKDDPMSTSNVIAGSRNELEITAQSSPVFKQWYESERGEQILREIMQRLMEPFPSTELSRDVNSKEIVIEIKTDQDMPLKARFPADFPDSPVQVIRGDRKEMIKFEFARSSHDTAFAHSVAATLCDKYLGKE